MSEYQEPIVNQVLFVSDKDLEAMEYWPLELRSLFDPIADQELAERIRREKQETMVSDSHDDIPF